MATALDPKLKAEALERVRAGETHVSIGRSLGVHQGTVSHWAAESGITAADSHQNVEAAQQRASLAWQVRRAELSEQWGIIAAEAQAAARAAVEAGKSQDFQRYATGAAVATDKAQLLNGEATSRSESLSIVADAADVRALRERLAAG